jgi:hypothetical protein
VERSPREEHDGGEIHEREELEKVEAPHERMITNAER